jgi:hypothetical protein
MQTTTSNESHKPVLPFVGRRKEAARLGRLHAQRKHALILSAAGVGKTELICHVARRLPVLVCPQSARLSEVFDGLERQLGLEAGDLHLIQRKNRLLQVLACARQTVVFDGVEWTTPKLSSFLECVMARVPVWIVARSDHSWDIGHVWPLLARFEKVEIKPFHLSETRELIEAAIRLRLAPPGTADAIGRLHHLCGGNPKVLCELIGGLATGHYNPHRSFDLRLLDLDRRIQHLPASETFHPLER